MHTYIHIYIYIYIYVRTYIRTLSLLFNKQTGMYQLCFTYRRKYLYHGGLCSSSTVLFSYHFSTHEARFICTIKMYSDVRHAAVLHNLQSST
jgi:hypothetical protein